MRQDVSGWTVRLDDDLVASHVRDGSWRNRTIADEVLALEASDPGRILLIDGESRITCAALVAQARALAAALRRRGLRPGHVVSFQLPNWHEASIINLAAVMCGLVVNPLVPIYREAEVGYMMRDCRSRLLFVPREFRRFDYPAMASRLRASLPDLAEVVVVRGEAPGCTSFADLLAEEAGSGLLPPAADPNAVKIVMYTSGTTGRPKGVLHTHNTIMTELDAVERYWRIGPGDVVIMPSPVTHVTGFLLALDLPCAKGVPAVLMETWDAEAALSLIRRHGCTLTVGATPFLQELLRAAEGSGERLPGFRLFACGGASVPAELIRQAYRSLDGCLAVRVYGSTEVPTITLGVPDRGAADLAATTDGQIYGNDVRLLDPATGGPAEPGQEGEIAARGPEMLVGYAHPDDNRDSFDADGFFKTGDLGRIVHGDYVLVTGRKKDLIIRGGENISPKEIEDALYKHPAVREVAVVSMPHARLGETVCAFVTLAPGHALTLPEVAAHLSGREGLAMQKVPERLEIAEELPKTPSGKIRKNVLRDEIYRRVAAETAA